MCGVHRQIQKQVLQQQLLETPCHNFGYQTLKRNPKTQRKRAPPSQVTPQFQISGKSLEAQTCILVFELGNASARIQQTTAAACP
ncbi:MAG: hypothetical protein ACI84R_004223, partial [Candidatus Azotimanducaceae bacterium]